MDYVPYLGVDNKRVVRIPASELRPGAIQVRIQGIDELVWVLPEKLNEGPVSSPPFGEDLLADIAYIQETFSGHRELTVEQWEDGFRRDADPKQEIDLWLHAADVYREFVGPETTEIERGDIYRIIVACLTASPDTVWNVIQLSELTRERGERVVERFYREET